ncbi:MAG: CBS domain-containing protein [Saprospiraceae bacterium]
MDFTAPVSALMTRKLITVSPLDRMSAVKEILDQHKVHHILVVRHTKLVGMISKSDYIQFVKCADTSATDKLIESSKLYSYTVEEVMTKGLATLESSDRINVALQVFSENLFHAIPIVDNDEVVGILTTYDIIKGLLEEDYARIKAN